MKYPISTISAVILAAILYGCAQFCSCLWFLSLICLVPLFWVVFRQESSRLPLWLGFVFGLLASILQLGCVFYSLSQNGPDQDILRRILVLVPPLLYSALLGLIFFGVPWVINKMVFLVTPASEPGSRPQGITSNVKNPRRIFCEAWIPVQAGDDKICARGDKTAGLPQVLYSLSWIAGAFIYFKFFAQWYMLPFGRLEGYVLTSPLVSLAQVPSLVFPLRMVGENIGLLILCLFMFLIALSLYKFTNFGLDPRLRGDDGRKYLDNGGVCENNKRKRQVHKALFAGGAALGIALSWTILGLYLQSREPQVLIKPYCDKIVSCPFFFYHSPNIYDSATFMGKVFAQAQKAFPHASLFITQESATRIHQWPYTDLLRNELSHKNTERPIKIILGGFRWDEDRYYNTLYFFDDGVLKQWHDKRHAMALDERIPWFVDFEWVKQAFFGSLTPTCPAQEPRRPFVIDNNLTVVPYICSELFFNNQPDEQPELAARHLPILACCNDNWTKFKYLHERMLLYARYCAIYWKRIIIYNGYHYNRVLAPDGSSCAIQHFDLVKAIKEKQKK